MHEKLAALWRKVNENLKDDWNLDRMSKIVCMSPVHFSRICRKYYETSPVHAVAVLRMQRAGELLSLTDWTLGEIAANVGYENPFAFSTAFKRIMGAPPKAYRKRYHEG
jgi:transcriptional regulator GlxA family with amidase domain